MTTKPTTKIAKTKAKVAGTKTKIAKLFRNGNSQAVRLPREMRFKGDRVRIRKVGDTVVLEPVITNVKEWLADLQRHPLSKDFMAEGREQPPAQERKLFE